MSIMIQLLLCVLVLAIVYATYIHQGEFYRKAFAILPDFRKLWQYTHSEFVKIEVLVHHGHAESIRNTILATHPGADPVITLHSVEGGDHHDHGHDTHGH